MNIKTTLFSFFLLFTSVAYGQGWTNCIDKSALIDRAALIQKEGRGKGSGFLYAPNVVVTNHHVIEDVEKIWVWIPKLMKSIPAKVLYSTAQPDIAVLQLKESVPDIETLLVSKNVSTGLLMQFVSFPFGRKDLLGATFAQYNSRARFVGDTKTYYFNAILSDWAYAGDSGGAFYNCDGELVGVNFANRAMSDPDHIYAVNASAVRKALAKAGVWGSPY